MSGTALPPASGSFTGPISATGGPDSWAVNAVNHADPGVNYGIRIQAGSNTVDAALRIVNHEESTLLMLVRGDGLVLFSTQVASGAGAGDIVIKNGSDLRSVNAAGTGTISLVELNTSNHVVLAPEGQHIRWGQAFTALGGGSTATLGTVGGSGPTNPAQTGWRPVIDGNGTLTWEPFWV